MLKLRRFKKEYNHNEVLDMVRKHEVSLHREMKLEAYYKNQNSINRTVKADGKANHKVAHPFCHQIVSTMVGYFASEPVQFDIDNEQVKQQLDDFMKYNDFDRVFTKVVTDSCVYGVGSMMTFIDVKGQVRFASVDPKELIVIVNNDVLEEIHTVIRHWQCESNDGEIVRYVEVYDSEKVRKFYMNEEEIFNEIVEEHFFGDVPFSLFYANADQMSIFERIIPLVDAYDLLESETLNLVSDLADAILLIAGCELDDDMIKQVNQMRLLNVSDINENQVDVRYITKDAPDHETTKQRLHDDIFSLSMIPDVNSKDFGQALSGTALKLRLASMEFLAGVMEGFAKLGLRRLIELWANVGALLGGVSTDEIIKNLSIRMTRNTVSNEAEQIQNALQLSSLISKESVLALLQAFIPDVEVELERLNKEREESIEFMQDEFNAHQPVEDEEEETWDTGSKDKDEDEE
jgi:SPP1 family phage portal protein